ncbi:Arginase/deacetylase [Tricholoma matsutake]|nr:Arginase/deacetylase [Tricholoma matsutake 945]
MDRCCTITIRVAEVVGSSRSSLLLQAARRPVAVFFQDTCLQHQYIRSKDLSTIVERPERLRAVKIGLAAAIARLESVDRVQANIKPDTLGEEQHGECDDLTAAMGGMNLAPSPQQSHSVSQVSIVQSHSSVDILKHPAVKFVHGDIDGDTYLDTLTSWAKESWDKIHQGGSEIPEHLPQGDLYLCTDSINAIQGAIGAVCEAVDKVVSSVGNEAQASSLTELPVQRAFVAIRPPGHHCGEDTPSGFCFVNNVAIAAAHAHLQHGINRIVILDIDLHHGNGTQSIVWQINEDTYRQTLEAEAGEGAASFTKPGLQVYYGSIHDILSFPCEDGKPELVQAASVSIHKSHGQYIENIHLQTYTSEQHFWDVLYKDHYSKILQKAEDFLDATGGPGEDVMVFISCGMDACEHEYASMSRHNRKVPTSFYYRFAQDVCAFSDKYARGRVVSVLEGGYSDRALISGAMAHLSGLADDAQPTGGNVKEEWWNVESLEKLEKATKKRRGGRQSLTTANFNSVEPWLERTLEILSSLDTVSPPLRKTPAPAPISMILRNRDRKSKSKSGSMAPSPSPSITSITSEAVKAGNEKPGPVLDATSPPMSVSSSSESSESRAADAEAPKKLPRVILRLGPHPSVASSS